MNITFTLFASITCQKAVIQELSVVDCPVEPHILPALVKMKKFFTKRPTFAFPRLRGNSRQSCQV